MEKMLEVESAWPGVHTPTLKSATQVFLWWQEFANPLKIMT